MSQKFQELFLNSNKQKGQELKVTDQKYCIQQNKENS